MKHLFEFKEIVFRDIQFADAKAGITLTLAAMSIGGTASFYGSMPDPQSRKIVLTNYWVLMLLFIGLGLLLIGICFAVATVLPRSRIVDSASNASSDNQEQTKQSPAPLKSDSGGGDAEQPSSGEGDSTPSTARAVSLSTPQEQKASTPTGGSRTEVEQVVADFCEVYLNNFKPTVHDNTTNEFNEILTIFENILSRDDSDNEVRKMENKQLEIILKSTGRSVSIRFRKYMWVGPSICFSLAGLLCVIAAVIFSIVIITNQPDQQQIGSQNVINVNVKNENPGTPPIKKHLNQETYKSIEESVVNPKELDKWIDILFSKKHNNQSSGRSSIIVGDGPNLGERNTEQYELKNSTNTIVD
jgi:hypothetical protein